ncbi:DnaJ domain-containing protein [candidate division WOR-3 bacterium]|nr:DnaJ domain-containing protein [candidate division WOR-3 bacterium]
METYYSILQVSATATPDEIKRSYLKLAQKYHPDRYTDSEEKKTAHEKFSRITESYRILSDENLRQEYDRSLSKGTSKEDEAKETQAKNAFKRAIAFMKQNDPWRAVNLLRIACRYNPQPMYISYLGLALVYTRQYQKEGFEKLKLAISKMMFNPTMHINLGLAYEFCDDKAAALQAYFEALNWDKTNVTALRGVERMQTKKKGFLSRLFGG